jgi:thioredoxin 1
VSNIEALTDDNFDELVLRAPVPVLVDFWAEWCGPCKAMMPAIEDVAREYREEAKVYKLNVDQNPKVRDRYGIRGIPACLIFRDGKLVDTIVGVASRTSLGNAIESALASADGGD